MYEFNDNQTQSQIAAAINAGGFTLVSFAVVGPDTDYTQGSVTVLLITDANDSVGYRTPVDGISAGKTYVASLVSTYNLGSKFNTATVDDGAGTQYTLAEVEAW
jgi:hypothetical protein